MTVKKWNAMISLLTFLAMLLHIGYNDFAYLTFYYNPALKTATSVPFMVCTCIHAVLGMLAVFLLGDGTRANLYPKKNVRTIIQRVTAAFIFPMLIIHLKTFELLKSASAQGQWVGWWLLIVAEVVFFGTLITHAAVSVTKSLITLGWLSSRELQKKLDVVIYAFSVLLFMVSVFAVVKGQIAMFLKMGGGA